MGIFSENAPQYRAAGFEPRPVPPGSKASKAVGWNRPDEELPEDTFASWHAKFGDHGIGLRLGTKLHDGTVLAALDIDDDRFLCAAQFLLNDPPCGRIGSKGAAFFVRVWGDLKKARVTLDTKALDNGTVHIGELLGPGALVVIPPTIHPGTGKPYHWIGTPLLEININDLPLVEV
jgi:hypothetical protein